MRKDDTEERLRILNEIYYKYPEIGDPEVNGIGLELIGFGESKNTDIIDPIVRTKELEWRIPYIGFGENAKAKIYTEAEEKQRGIDAAERIANPYFQQPHAVKQWIRWNLGHVDKWLKSVERPNTPKDKFNYAFWQQRAGELEDKLSLSEPATNPHDNKKESWIYKAVDLIFNRRK
jgi:hypothetical protein